MPLINVGSKKKNTGSIQNVFYFIKLEPEPEPVPVLDLQTGSGQSVRLRNTAHRFWYQFSFLLTKIIHIKLRMRTGGSRRALGPAWRVGVSTLWSTYPGTMRPPTATGLASGYPLKQSGRYDGSFCFVKTLFCFFLNFFSPIQPALWTKKSEMKLVG